MLVALALGASAAVLRVPEEHPSLQAAFGASAEGDTVLVARGTWAGLVTGPAHTVTLCSNHLFTGDTTDIVETVLDGEYAGTLLDIHSGPGTWFTLHGLTLQRGQGQILNTNIYCDRAAALHVTDSTNVRIEHVVFRENRAPRRAAILHVGRQCSGLGSRSLVVMRKVHCVNNRHDTIGENHQGAMAIKLNHGAIDLRGIRFVDTPDSGRQIYAMSSNGESAVFDDIKVTNCLGDLRLEAPSTNGEMRFTNISIDNPEGARGCLLSLAGSLTTPDSSVVVAHNIRVQGGVYTVRGPLGAFGLSPMTLDMDSVAVSHVRYLPPGNQGRLVVISPTQPGILRNLHLHHNVSGDSTQHVGVGLCSLTNMDVIDAHIHDNRVILPPRVNASQNGGNSIEGAMLLVGGGVRRFENLIFENNVVEDLDDYSNQVPTEAYHRNWGRELFAWGQEIEARHIRVRNSRLSNPCPEIYSPADIDLSGPGSTITMFARTLRIEDVVLADCDDGGFSFTADSLWMENVVLRNVGRVALNNWRAEFPGAPPYLRFRNLHIENVDASLNFLSPPMQRLSQQAVLFMDVVSDHEGVDPVVDMENVTVTGCDGMRHLFNFYEPVTLNLRSCLFWNNSYGQLVGWDDPVTVNWDYSLVEEEVPGEGNLIGLDPLFDPLLGPPFLSADSPCIDAGTPDPAFDDREDPESPGFALWPSQGTRRNDIGFTGGPGAAIFDTAWVALPRWEPRLVPQAFTLGAPWPNPFNPVTRIPFTLARPEIVRLSVHNLLGQEVAVLAHGVQFAGRHEVPWDAGSLASGVYVVHLETGGQTQSRTITLLR